MLSSLDEPNQSAVKPERFISPENPEMKIIAAADALAKDIRERGTVQFAEALRKAWTELKKEFKDRGDGFMEVKKDKLGAFNKEIWPTSIRIFDKALSKNLRDVLEEGSKTNIRLSAAYDELNTIFNHDIMHILPRLWLIDPFLTLEMSKAKGNPDKLTSIVPTDWVNHFDTLISEIEQSVNAVALVVEYCKGVAEVNLGIPTETKQFKLIDTLTAIARIMKGRFYFDDYELLINPTEEETKEFKQNRIVVIVDPNLVLNSAEGFIFADIYNLVKNSAKAISEKIGKQLNPPKEKEIYYVRENHPFDYRLDLEDCPLEPFQIIITAKLSEKDIVFTIDDTGVGISIDGALEKVKRTMRDTMNLDIKLGESSWYKAMEALGLSQDAQMFISWAEGDHNAIRHISIGSILSIQHLFAYEADSWRLRSFTSGGIGMLSINYLVHILGGSVLGTNKFNGGAFFTLSLPKASVGLK